MTPDNPHTPLPILVHTFLGAGANLDQLQWRHFAPGIEIFRLYGNQKAGPSAALLRYEPGACAPYHVHTGYEHVLVLRGSQSDERGDYPTGTLVINPPGSGHSIVSRDGCVVLLIWEKPVEFV